jgi:hypothetical protein
MKLQPAITVYRSNDVDPRGVHFDRIVEQVGDRAI